MPRPRMKKRVRFCPRATYFKPRGIPMRNLEIVVLNHEELEAIRLKNVKGFDQITAAEKMNTSQSTFQRILNSAYSKISDALVSGKVIEIRED